MIDRAPTADLPALLVRLWHCLSRRRRRQFMLLMGLVVISAFAEVFTLGALLPFLGILVAPERVLHHPMVATLARHWGITSATQLILPVTLLFASIALFAGAIRILLLWASTRLAYSTGSDLSIDVYRRTLYQPYDVQVSQNSSEVISGVVSKVHETVYALGQMLLLISSALVMFVITVALIVIDPLVAAIAIVGFGFSYGILASIYRRQLRQNSQRIAAESTQAIKALQEGLGGIRDVLLDGTQAVYCDIYRRADNAYRRAQGNNQFISASPRFAMEAIGMVLIAALAYGLSRQSGGVATALPVLGTLVLGAQRLLPALQQTYSAWAFIAGSYGSVTAIVELLDQPLPEAAVQPLPLPLHCQHSIGFNRVRFRYTSAGPWVLNDLTLVIYKGSRVGFVGSTGSGKSTALDLLMGLLRPTEGELLVDGEPVTGNRIRAWQRSIAHVPQSIYLADATVAENIAFGVPRNAMDMGRVKLAAQQAQIAEFIESQAEGYHAYVGERGIRLSGGQRQRIGIARALYKQASILIFDEATSALDNATEQSVMDAIAGLNRDLTIVLIAHRLTTVRHCDSIIELERGRLVAQGTFEQLLECSPSFRRMAKAVA
ncbi:MAG: ABC transporter ATP-binding protein [Steroidobacteraceae bacterium]|jgi:ATP-binding cassette subfamily B protein